MKLVDLHIHSTASDGTVAPEALPGLARAAGLCAIALTDHDTMAGVAAAQRAGVQEGVTVLAGLEISTDDNGREIHLLGYGLEPDAPSLRPVLEWTVQDRDARNRRIVQMLQRDGYHISLEQLKEEHPGTVIGRPHMAEALLKAGQVGSMQEAFDRLLGEGCPYFLPRSYMPFDQAAQVIHQAGGVAVLAHPYQYGFTEEGLRALIARAKHCGAVGLETYYSGYTREQVTHLLALGAEFGLIATGGSDFHGTRKPSIHLGSGTGELKVPYAAFLQLKERMDERSK